MSWTKRQFVEQAFEELGLASYTYDIQSNQFQSALRRLDSMMAKWNSDGIRIGYPLPSSPEDSDLDKETEVPDAANEAIYTNLAMKIAPSFGKIVSKDLISNAKQAYTALLGWVQKVPEIQFPETMPAGSGSKYWRYNSDPFMPQPTDGLAPGEDSVFDFE